MSSTPRTRRAAAGRPEAPRPFTRADTVADLWPWLVVAGAGALHGLNPATGWALAAGCGLHAGDGRQALRALVPITTGHLVSVVVVATAVALGYSMADWAWPAMGLAAVGSCCSLFIA
jgi:hypothetical protein